MTPRPLPGPHAAGRLPREARLKRRRLIRPLFERGREDVGSVAVGCVRLLYRLANPEDTGSRVPVQAGFIATRRTGNAVARNRVKRILREVYRKNQTLLKGPFSEQKAVLTLMVLFRGAAPEAPVCIPRDLPRALRRLAEQLPSTVSDPPGS